MAIKDEPTKIGRAIERETGPGDEFKSPLFNHGERFLLSLSLSLSLLLLIGNQNEMVVMDRESILEKRELRAISK